MKKITITTLSLFISCSFFSMDQSRNGNVHEEPTVKACMHYYCCNPTGYYKNINPEKIAKTGVCLTCTGLVTKTVEFSLFSCCYQNASLNYACKNLWFPSCNHCSNASICCGGTFDIGCTVLSFAGPLVWTAGKIWGKYKKETVTQSELEEKEIIF